MTDALFAVDVENRTLRGLVLPYGEKSRLARSGNEPIMFASGAVELPTDPSIITLNEDHDQLEPRGRAIAVEETDQGVVAEFQIAATPEGDALLARAQQEPRPRLSAELRDIVRNGANAVSAKLRGTAVVAEGAFASAGFFAIGDVTEEQKPGETDVELDDQTIEKIADRVAVKLKDTEGEQPGEKEDMTASATVPDGLARPAGTSKDKTTVDGLFAALAMAGMGSREVLTPFAKNSDALFAIATIQDSGTAGKTIAADTLVPAFVGELWKRRPFDRRFVPLVNHADLTGMKVVGWRWTTEPTVADYAGNTAEIPSNAVDTEPVEVNATRIAGGHKLDRRYVDFGDTSVYASYFSTITENYSRFTDAKGLAAIIAAATATTPGTVPAGTAKGLAAVVDGALDVIANDNNPSFAIVSPELWRDIILISKDDVLGYLSASLGLESGDLSGFHMVPGNVGAGKVIVGAKEAMTIYELPGAPIRVEGIDPHHGAIDPAIFGYWATITHNAAAIRSITVAA